MSIADVIVTEWAPADSPFEPSPTWVDISSRVRKTRTYSGQRSPRDVMGAGSAAFEVNNDLGAGAWLDKDTWFRGVQIRATTADSILFRGWVKGVVYDFGFRDGISQARIDCVDAIGLLTETSADADFTSYAEGSPIGAVTARTFNNRTGYVTDGGVADVAAWLLATAQVAYTDAGYSGRIPMFVESKQAGNALQLLQDYLEADIGRLAAVGAGITLLGRYADFELAAATSVATLADDGTGYKWRLGSLVLAAPDETYIDDATFGGPGIENQRTTATPANFPPASYVRTTQSPITDVNWAKANADMTVELGKQTDTFPRSLTCHVMSPSGADYDSSHPAVVGLVGQTPFDVKFQGTTYKVVPSSIEHTVDESTGGWWTTFGFRSLDRIINAYGGDAVFKVGTSSWGGPDIFGP